MRRVILIYTYALVMSLGVKANTCHNHNAAGCSVKVLVEEVNALNFILVYGQNTIHKFQ